jgi:HEPN domain-containing protein
LNDPKDSSYSRDWLEIARRDWRRVALVAAHDDPQLAGFLLQQCLEKYLKAYLLARSWKLRRTHDLGALLDFAGSLDPALEGYRDLCERVAGYYLAERYPVLGAPDLDMSRLLADRDQARDFILAMHPDECLDT